MIEIVNRGANRKVDVLISDLESGTVFLTLLGQYGIKIRTEQHNESTWLLIDERGNLIYQLEDRLVREIYPGAKLVLGDPEFPKKPDESN